jgi:hypothetical protein
MTPLAKAHKKLRGDLNNSTGGLYKGELYLFRSLDSSHYITSYFRRCDGIYEYISTVEEFINFKGDDVETVYTQEMADNGVLPSVGSNAQFVRNDDYMMEFSINDGDEVECICHTKDVDGGPIGVYRHKDGFSVSILTRLIKPLTPPIELVDGKAYQFDIGKKTRLGFFKGSGFSGGIRSYWELSACTNIKPLTVEGK